LLKGLNNFTLSHSKRDGDLNCHKKELTKMTVISGIIIKFYADLIILVMSAEYEDVYITLASRGLAACL
jgi:hypothetical protein